MQLAALSSDGALSGGDGGRGGRRGDGGVYALLRDSQLRASLRITVACAMAQQFSGINNAFNFSSTFLSANGIDAATVTLIAVLMNIGNVFVTILSAWLMDRAGRRALLLRSTLAMSASIVALTVALCNPGQSWTALLAIVSCVSFVCSFGAGMGPVPWLLPAELFPADKVATGSAFAAMCNWLANFVCGLIFLPLASTLGGWCFVPFLAVLLPFALFVASIPETRGKSVQQILVELAQSEKPPSSLRDRGGVRRV